MLCKRGDGAHQHQRDSTGVLAPEAGHIDPRVFIEDVFEELSKAIDQPLGGFEDNVAISRSW